jgi:8-amino-7-oxononanoate synthase
MSSWIDDDLRDRHERGLFRRRRILLSAQGPRVRVGGREYVNFSSNDYLGLAADPRLAAAAARAARRYGCGAGASPLVSGLLPPLRRLERDLARFEGAEAAVVFGSGYAANLGLLSAVVGRGDAVFSDELNHASLIDGCRLSRTRVFVYRHGDGDHLADLLRREGPSARRRLVVSDTVFSMDGDLAPLPALYDLAGRFDGVLLLDEAHATGVLGERGRGLTELCPPPPGLDPDAVIKVGTLSKALAAQGGFVCGSRRLATWVVNHARPYIFSTALAPPAAAAARRAVSLLHEEPERRGRVLALAAGLRDQLTALGLSAGPSACPIVPVMTGDPRAAVRLSGLLRQRGFLVPAIRPPSVPEGTSRLRVSLTAGHTEEDVGRFVEALRDTMSAGVVTAHRQSAGADRDP